MAKKNSIISERGALTFDNLQAINQVQEEPTEKGNKEEKIKKYTIQTYLTESYVKKYEKMYTRFILSIDEPKIFKKDFVFVMLKAYANYLEEKGLLKTPPNRQFVSNFLRRLGGRKREGEKKIIYVFCQSKREEEYNLLDDILYSLANIIEDPNQVQNQAYYFMKIIDYFDENLKKLVDDFNKNPQRYVV